MKLLQEINERAGMLDSIKTDGFVLTQEEEFERDNVKIFHTIKSPDGKKHDIDFSPYESMGTRELQFFVMFYKKHNRFPSRKDIGGTSPIDSKTLMKLDI